MKKNSTLSRSVSSYCRRRLRRLVLRSFALSAFLLAGTVSASAQLDLTNVGILPTDDSGLAYCPSLFSYGNKTYFFEQSYYSYDENIYSYKVYDSKFNNVRQITLKNNPRYLDYHDFDQSFGFGGNFISGIAFTQTLFNNDDKFEAIVVNQGADNRVTGFSVVQEDGKVLFTTQLEYCDYFYIFKIDNSYFLAVHGYESEGFYLYSIDREGSSSSGLTFVKKIKGMSVSPTVLDRSTPVTVDFKEGEGQHEVRVVTAGGKTVHKESVDGASSVTLDTSRWGSGMNIVTVRDKNGKTESCKVIVK